MRATTTEQRRVPGPADGRAPDAQPPQPAAQPTGTPDVRRWAGGFGVAAALLLVAAMPLYVIRGTPPPLDDAAAFAEYVTRNNTNFLTGILLMEASLPTFGAIGPILTALFLAAAGYATLTTGLFPPWTGWLAYAVALLSLGAVPAIYGGKDFLEAVIAGGGASWGVYSYISSLAGLAYLLWLFSAAISMVAPSLWRRRPHPSSSSMGR